MSEQSKRKLMAVSKINSELADVLEAAGLITPRDIKLADNADLEAAGLTLLEIEKVRAKCPAHKAPKE